jgi:peptidoglycan hydrolase FlgJ
MTDAASPAPRAGFLPAPAPSPSPEDLRIRRTARAFESSVIATMVESMLATGEVETFGGGHAEQMWRSFQARAIADQIAAQGGIGIARSVEGAMRAYGGAPQPGAGAAPPPIGAEGSADRMKEADRDTSGAR